MRAVKMSYACHEFILNKCNQIYTIVIKRTNGHLNQIKTYFCHFMSDFFLCWRLIACRLLIRLVLTRGFYCILNPQEKPRGCRGRSVETSHIQSNARPHKTTKMFISALALVFLKEDKAFIIVAVHNISLLFTDVMPLHVFWTKPQQ